MKVIKYYLKKVFSIFIKVIIAILLGIGASFGNKPVEMESKDNKIIELDK